MRCVAGAFPLVTGAMFRCTLVVGIVVIRVIGGSPLIISFIHWPVLMMANRPRFTFLRVN